MKGSQLMKTLGFLAITYVAFGVLSGAVYMLVVPGDADGFFTSFIPLLLVVMVVFLLVSVLMLRFLPKVAWLTPIVLSLLAFSGLYFAFPGGLSSDAAVDLTVAIIATLSAPGLFAYFAVWVWQRRSAS